MEDLSSFVQQAEISDISQTIANENNFVIKSYRFPGQACSDSKIVRIGSVQTAITAPTHANAIEQRDSILQKVEKMIEAAAAENVNILCLPEMWYMPYPFYTPDDITWRDFGEDLESGPTSNIIRKLATQYKMIIISSILEKETEDFYNTTVITSTTGHLIGKYRKIHIPPIERPFLQPGSFNHEVFDTEFGKIGIVICYERHFPLCWMMHGLSGADIVFNPSSEDVHSMSERLWFAEGVNAAVSNAFYTVMVNRTGTESFSNGRRFRYFGSNFVTSPYGYTTPHLTTEMEGLLVTEIDLNVCRKVREEFSIHQNGHLDLYIDKLNHLKLN